MRVVILATRAKASRLANAKLVALAISGNQLKNAVERNISAKPVGGTMRSHRAFLRAMGSPYARRHGSIQYNAKGGLPGFRHPEAVVHSVTGRMKDALMGRVDRKGPQYVLSIDDNRAPHAKYVILGTKVMLPRDVLNLTALEPSVRLAMKKTWIRVLGQMFRTQSIIRFE